MTVLINARSAARLAAACAVVVAAAPATVSASTAKTGHHATAARHVRIIDGLCDGHRWSLFGCRPDSGHHPIGQAG